MNTQNLEYLKDSMKYTGFDTQLNADLEKNIQAGLPDFLLKHTTKIDNDDMNYLLHFRKGDQNETYFFNKMEATLKKPGEDAQEISQTFYPNQGITAKEAYNLLDGRAVNTDLAYKDNPGERYNAWVQLDFSTKDKHQNFQVDKYTEKYGFDVDKEVGKINLKEHEEEHGTERLIKSLKKGNLAEATLTSNSEKIFLTANPKEKGLNVYDANMKKLSVDELKEKIAQKQTENAGDDSKKKLDQKTTNDDDSSQKQKRGKKV